MLSKVFWKPALIVTSMLIEASISHANAATYSNTIDSPTYYSTPEIINFGQEFTTSGGLLTDWSFYVELGHIGNLNFVIASWDGEKPVGPALYSATTYYDGNGAQALSFTDINVQLSSGSYISYLSGKGVTNYSGGLFLGASFSDGGLGGGLRFSDLDGVTWHKASNTNLNLAFTAVINPVPEPENLAMMLAGLGLLGFASRRNK